MFLALFMKLTLMMFLIEISLVLGKLNNAIAYTLKNN
jgi:hypothetical protein